MERARAQAERDREPTARRWLQHAIALAAALLLVGIVMLGFDAFLTAMQKYMEAEVVDPPPAPAQAPAPAPPLTAPMPAYVVPGTVNPPPPEDPGPRPSRAPAQDTSPATP